jgi:iron complex outermembrane receptor protein
MRSIIATLLILTSLKVFAQQEELTNMSLEDLLNTPITSVSKIEEKRSTSPAVVDVITNDMIRNYGYRTLYDVLMKIPGFTPITDVNDKIVGVRGVHSSVNQKFLVLVNGKRLTDNLFNLSDIDYNMSLSNVKSIEIIRGPGSAIYGRAALTAVINVITYTGGEIDGAKLNLTLGNYGYREIGFAFGTKLENGAQIDVYGHGTAVDGQVFDVSASEDASKKRVDGKEVIDRFKFPTGGFGARYLTDDWKINLLFQSREYQQPRATDGQLNFQDIEANKYYNQAFKDRLLGEDHRYLIFDIQRDFKIGEVDNSITFNYTFSSLRLRENTKPFREITFPSTWNAKDSLEYGLGELFEFNVESYRAGFEYFGLYSFGQGKNALWGAEIYIMEPILDQFHSNFLGVVSGSSLIKTPITGGYFREKPDGLFDKLRTEWLYSLFGEVKYSFTPKLLFTLGARYDVHVKGEDFKQEGIKDRYPDPLADKKRSEIEKTTSQLSPRVALIYQPLESDELTFKAIYNKSFIAPSYFYRYADPSTSYAGGPWLKPETLDSYIFDVESIFNSIAVKVLYFLNINKDLLTRDVTLSPPRYTSLGKLAMNGVEMDLNYQVMNYNFFANYSFMQGVKSQTDNTSAKSWIMDDNSIKNFPKHTGNFGFTGRFFENSLNASLIASWHGKIKSPLGGGIASGTVAELNSAVKFDFTIRYQPKQVEELDLTISVYNLLDKKEMLGGTVKRPYNTPGRWFNFSIIKGI